MLRYYIRLAMRSLMRNPVLTTLIVLEIGLGLGASMTMITVLHVMAGDPVPTRSAELFYPHLEPGPAGFSSPQFDPGSNFTWPDANNLLRAHRAKRQAMMAGGRVAVTPTNGEKSFYSTGHYVSNEFFAMFGAPFSYGEGWSAQDDEDRSRLVVLNSGLAHRLFGDTEAVGRIVHLQGLDFRVTGVLHRWHPVPLFYGGLSGDWAFKSDDEFFLPITTAMSLKLPITGGEACWGNGGRTSGNCTWLQFWVELDSPDQVAAYKSFLNHYWREQEAHGRFPQDQPPILYGLMQRLRALRLVPSDVRLQLWLALGFLGVCLFNTVGLMLAKFLRRIGEISVRRAMGARRQDIFTQLSMEALVVGLTGGVLGLLLTWFGLWLVRQRPDAYARLAHFDPEMVLGTFIFAVIASVLAGLLPAWRACRIPPASQLKVQ
ncbi:MAG: ABC transporter permease [Rhodanobacteraceae bacterium]